jgi:hypothetical protein
MINESYLAVLYYNLQKPNFYDITNPDDRKKANRNFANTKKIDISILEIAFEMYKKALQEEFELLKNNKKAPQ